MRALERGSNTRPSLMASANRTRINTNSHKLTQSIHHIFLSGLGLFFLHAWTWVQIPWGRIPLEPQNFWGAFCNCLSYFIGSLSHVHVCMNFDNHYFTKCYTYKTLSSFAYSLLPVAILLLLMNPPLGVSAIEGYGPPPTSHRSPTLPIFGVSLCGPSIQEMPGPTWKHFPSLIPTNK